jgi:DNA-binding CsgD family transcriptional regulator
VTGTNLTSGQAIAALAAASEVALAADCAQFAVSLRNAARSMGFDQAAFGIEFQPCPGIAVRHVESSYPAEFQRVYWREKLIDVDPTVAHCKRANAPVIWSRELYDSSSEELFELAADFGLRHGLSIPVHEGAGISGMLSLARDRSMSDSELVWLQSAGLLLAHAAHVTAKRLQAGASTNGCISGLSEREIQCLRWAAAGKSNSVIAQLLEISEPTVVFHLGRIFGKLGVGTRAQAAVVAWRLGLAGSRNNYVPS